LVGSTALSAKLDPEDLRGLIAAYHRCCTELIDGGFVTKYMGDGVLAYFGYPQAHEHDAERAVRKGLNLVEAVPKLASNAGSPCRFASVSRPASLWWATSSRKPTSQKWNH
jgi:class 3 adenylate cyclase